MSNKIYDASLLLAGNCIFTAKSDITGKEFSYKIARSPYDKHTWFARVLLGDNKQSRRDWYLLAIINQYYDPRVGYVSDYLVYQNSNCIQADQQYKVLEYLFKYIPEYPHNVTLYHEGRCARCGRRLTSVESIKLGLGKECRKL